MDVTGEQVTYATLFIVHQRHNLVMSGTLHPHPAYLLAVTAKSTLADSPVSCSQSPYTRYDH